MTGGSFRRSNNYLDRNKQWANDWLRSMVLDLSQWWQNWGYYYCNPTYRIHCGIDRFTLAMMSLYTWRITPGSLWIHRAVTCYISIRFGFMLQHTTHTHARSCTVVSILCFITKALSCNGVHIPTRNSPPVRSESILVNVTATSLKRVYIH